MPSRSYFKAKAKRAFAARKIQRHHRKKKASNAQISRVVKRELLRGTESKYIQTDLPNSLAPTTTAVAWTEIDTPAQGTAVNRRVGREVMFTHLCMKLRVGHDNFGDTRSNATLIGYLVFLKNAAFATEFETNVSRYMFNVDSADPPGYSPLSMMNKAMYPNWMAVAKIKVTMKDFVPVAQAPMGLQSTIGDPAAYPTPSAVTNNELARQPQTQFRYVTVNKRIRVKGEWGTIYNSSPAPDPTVMTRNKPYFVCLSDMPSNSIPSGTGYPIGRANDRIFVNGIIRLSYHDA